MTIETFDRFNDGPADRADQLVAAADWLGVAAQTEGHPLQGLVDADRVAYAGFSMGGGGALLAAQQDPSADAVLALAPFLGGASAAGVSAPSLVVGCENDVFAPVATEVLPAYQALTVEKTYVEIAGANHSCPTNELTPYLALIGRFMIAWTKYFVDGDPRYEPFICGPDLVDASVSDYRTTCPVG
jgi:triacylglycerol lipase